MQHGFESPAFYGGYKDAKIYGYDTIPSSLEKEKILEDGGCKDCKLFVFASPKPDIFYQYIVKFCGQDAYLTTRKIDKNAALLSQHLSQIVEYLVEQLQTLCGCLYQMPRDSFKIHIYTPFQIVGLEQINNNVIRRDAIQHNLPKLLQHVPARYSVLILNFGGDNKCTTNLQLQCVKANLAISSQITNCLYELYVEQQQPLFNNVLNNAAPQPQNPIFNAAPQPQNPIFNAAPQPQNPIFNAAPQPQNPFNAAPQPQNPFNAAPQPQNPFNAFWPQKTDTQNPFMK